MLDFVIRRNTFFSKMKENSVAVFFSGVSKIASEDHFLPFTSNRNFFYLTGIEQEDSILVLFNGLGGERKTYLFVEEYDEIKEKWMGKKLTYQEAESISDINNVSSNKTFLTMLEMMLDDKDHQYGNVSTIYFDIQKEVKVADEMSLIMFKDQIMNKYKELSLIDSNPILCEMRMKKSSSEIGYLMSAINATNNGLNTIISSLKEGLYERDISDIFEFYGRKKGRLQLACNSICASGKNAIVLHYPIQNDIIKKNDLLLLDLGYKVEGYCADISRTYPVNGKFVGLQKAIYEAVLACNKAVINHVKVGMTIKELQEFTKTFLKKECVERGLLKEEEDILTVYYHGISHHLGLDTHDLSFRDKPFEDGNVITVEPGLYFKKFGIGVRIEDDVLIQDGRGVCLSKGIAKEVDEIERLFQTR